MATWWGANRTVCRGRSSPKAIQAVSILESDHFCKHITAYITINISLSLSWKFPSASSDSVKYINISVSIWRGCRYYDTKALPGLRFSSASSHYIYVSFVSVFLPIRYIFFPYFSATLSFSAGFVLYSRYLLGVSCVRPLFLDRAPLLLV